jgi:3'-phosphoadenosine 5'-phosphosulfate sulfotransferase (PAPS reductase)/FAD synthetase
MSFWNKQNVLEYLLLTGIPYAGIYGEITADPKTGRLKTTGAQRTGCAYCMFGAHLEKTPNRFQRMAAEHPNMYDYCMNKIGCGAVLDYLGVNKGVRFDAADSGREHPRQNER